MGQRFNDILETIGHTPVIRINRLGPPGVNLYVKMESFNPMGSVKDRLALGVIEDAERRGVLRPGQTIVEATSGNTGIGLAMVCARKGYPLVVTMGENFSVERRKLMRFLGARVVLTPGGQKGSGMVAKAEELAKAHGWWQPRQFENPANADIHASTTAIEILDDFADISLDYWVTGFGTGGTLNGVSRVLRDMSPNTKIIVCEPDNSAMLASGITQARNEDGSASASHPNYRPHLMQGWSPDFIPRLVDEVTQENRIDDVILIDGNDALDCARKLARQEGMFVGISAGATFAGALRVAGAAPQGASILCMLPDTGERYLSTPLFEDVTSEMTQEEIEISRSTPGYRFDVSTAASSKPAAPILVEKAIHEVEQLLGDPDRPIILFANEWCEFSDSVRKAFAAYAIPYTGIDLDSTEHRIDDLGNKMYDVIKQKSGSYTIPQIFIDGIFVGGCTEVFDEIKSGQLQDRLQSLDIKFDTSVNKDPYEFLPKWLLPR